MRYAHVFLLMYALAQPGFAQPNLPTLNRDVTYIYSNLGFQSDSLCVQQYQGTIDAFASQVRGITKSVRSDTSAFYDCAYTQVSNVQYTKNTIAEAATKTGLRCNPWSKEPRNQSALICQKGQIRTPGYWSIVQVRLASVGGNRYAVVTVGIESRKMN